jgi:hypothetical protein
VKSERCPKRRGCKQEEAKKSFLKSLKKRIEGEWE